MNSRLLITRSEIRCFKCEHEYSYIGADPHDGQCPRCKDECVSPAGELTPSSSRIVLIDDRPQIEVVATDATERSFRYRFSILGGCGTCSNIWIEDTELVKRKEWPNELLPPSIWRIVSEYGYPQCVDTANPD